MGSRWLWPLAALASSALGCEAESERTECAALIAPCDDATAAEREQCEQREGCDGHTVGSCAWEACKNLCNPAAEVAACIDDAAPGECMSHSCAVQCELECAPTLHACQTSDVEGQCVTSRACAVEYDDCKSECRSGCLTSLR